MPIARRMIATNRMTFTTSAGDWRAKWRVVVADDCMRAQRHRPEAFPSALLESRSPNFMNAVDSNSSGAAPPSAPTPANPPRGKAPPASRALVAVVALVLAVLGVFAWVDVRREGQSVRGEVAQRLAATDAALTQAKSVQSD